MESMAASATLHCLTGCATGEIVGLVIATALGLGAIAQIPIALALAFVFGYSLSSLPLLRSGMSVGRALRLVLAADTVSIATMEVVDNSVMALVPGALHAGLLNTTFWWSMGLAFVLAYAAAYPVNRWLLSRGQGHALTHEYMGGEPQVSDWRGRLPDPSPRSLAIGLAAFVVIGFVVALLVG